MGLFYTNITVKGADRDAVMDYLRDKGRIAWVAPASGDITVIYDRDCEDQDTHVLEALAQDLSRTLHSVALTALLHDDDVFWYALYAHGALADEYNSEPAYFDDTQTPEPSGGNARILCSAFGAGGSEDVVETILRQWWDGAPETINESLGAEERHRALAQALGLPHADWAYSLGYEGIEAGYLPGGVDRANFTKIGG